MCNVGKEEKRRAGQKRKRRDRITGKREWKGKEKGR